MLYSELIIFLRIVWLDMSKAKRLIVNADDFGISSGVNKGILEAHKQGIVTSTSLMVNMPYADEAVRMKKSLAPRLGLGLHLTLSWGKPILPAREVPSLVTSEGTFPNAFDIRPWTFKADHLRAEMSAQLQRFKELTGEMPDHIDNHQFVANILPKAFSVLIDLSKKHGIPIRNPSPFLDIKTLKDLLENMAGGKISIIVLIFLKKYIESNQAILKQHEKPEWPDRFEYHFYKHGSDLDNLVNILRELPEGTTELMCHPGYIEDLDEPYRFPREVELRLLTNPKILDLIKIQNIELISFAEL